MTQTMEDINVKKSMEQLNVRANMINKRLAELAEEQDRLDKELRIIVVVTAAYERAIDPTAEVRH